MARSWPGRVVAVAAVALLVGVATGAGAALPFDLESDSRPLLIAFDARDGKQQWQAKADGPGYFTVVGAGHGRVLAMQGRCLHADRDYRSGDVVLFVLDAETGREVWRARDAVGSGTAQDAFVLWQALRGRWTVVPVLSSDRRFVRGLDPRTGRVRWRTPSDRLIPVATNADAVVLASGFSSPPLRITTVDASTGAVRWSRTFEGSGPAHVVAGSNAVVVVPNGAVTRGAMVEMLVLEATTGSTRLTVPVITTSSNGFAITDDVAVLSAWSADTSVPGRPSISWRSVGYSLTTGAPLWDVPGGFWNVGQVGATPALFGTTTPDAPQPEVAAIHATTGTTLWRVDSPGYVLGTSTGNVAVGAGAEYDGSFGVVDVIGALDRETGALRWSKVPGRNNVEHSRRFPDVYTTGTAVGPKSIYIHGGCAATSLN
jgi:outer membrane protein assembly factor BamB